MQKRWRLVNGYEKTKPPVPAETGALVLKALQGATESLDDSSSDDQAGTFPEENGVPAGTCKFSERSLRMKRADALVLMAESFLATGAKELNGGDRHQVVIHVAAEILQHKGRAHGLWVTDAAKRQLR